MLVEAGDGGLSRRRMADNGSARTSGSFLRLINHHPGFRVHMAGTEEKSSCLMDEK
jgi:hypothetical protein